MPPLGRHVSRLSGYAPDIPTPFDNDGNVDGAALERLCHLQIREGATALVVCDTDGETSTLTRAERNQIVRIAASAAGGRVPVIAGAGSNSTSGAVEFAIDAEGAGADALLSVVPYYNKPLQAGMYAHFRTVAERVGLPIILHDVPSRTVCGLADATIARLAENRQIIGLKDGTGDITRPLRLRAMLGSDFRLMSGDDHTALAFTAQGGNGCISVTSNIVPELCRSMYLALKAGILTLAERLAGGIMRLTEALLAEGHPAPVKYALDQLAMMPRRVRLPLVEPNDQTKAEISSVLSDMCQCFSDYMIGTYAAGDSNARQYKRTAAN
jgi:4-hydroxy-tetrahydrodipicolinate synthase